MCPVRNLYEFSFRHILRDFLGMVGWKQLVHAAGNKKDGASDPVERTSQICAS